MQESPHCRIDQWPVAARFFKTRQLAVSAIKNGRILVAGARCKPARLLQIGDIIDIHKSPTQEYTVRVLVLETRRPAAKIAATFYEESVESQAKREKLAALQQQARAFLVKYPQQRPDKRERRQLRDIQRHSSSSTRLYF